MSMSVAPDEAIEFTTGSFYEVSQFKRTVARIDNGHKQCDELMSFIRERAAIEEQYCKMIRNWSAKYTKIIEKGSCYHTLQQSWLGMIKESEQLADVHQHVGKDLLKEDLDKVKAWKKTHYHSLTLGGLKETKTCNDEFAKAQKPWAKLYKKVMDSKKLYYQSCKEERSAQMQENTAKSDSTLPPEKVKKLEELVEKKGADRQKQKDKYESALSELDSYNSKYMEDMEMVFDKCQEFDKGRLQHFKEILLTVQDHLDFSKKSQMKEINDRMHQCLQRANDESDLEWWRMNHGPGMAMSWPMFEEYDAERIHMQRNITKRTGGKVSKHVAGVDGMAGAQFTQNNEYSSYPSQTSTNGGANQRPTSWSDDEQNNPFDDDVIDGEGVPVIALYDYVGAEEDELSFKAGEKLYKLEDEDEQGWCRGKTDQGVSGLYPANYVKPI